jgi:carboxyl-terminal processing protease
MHMRQGHIGFTVSPQERAFLGPVALLIDSGSASTSEIMAAGLQEAGRARIFGESSPGAALPSNFKTLPTGDLFQYAIADLQTPNGILIEGRGVTPDELVPCTRADLAAGRDPALEAARRWLDRERRKAPPAGPSHP